MPNIDEDPETKQIIPRTRNALLRFFLILVIAAGILLLIRYTILQS